MEPLDRLVAGVDRLEKGCLFKRNLVGNLHKATTPHDGRHHSDVLCEASTGRSEAGCAPDVLIGVALREGLLAAVEALSTRDVVVSHHPVAYGKAVDAFACADNCARHLMPKDPRRIVRAGVNLLEVGAADSAGVDLHQYLAGADLRHRDSLDANVVHAAIDCSTHRCG